MLFWMLSIIAWNFVFNPGVEAFGAVLGEEGYGLELALLFCLFFIYCLLPFCWLIKTWRRPVKIILSILFLIPILMVPGISFFDRSSREIISVLKDIFFSRFLYTLIFHLPIAAAVYLNLKVLVVRFLNGSRFGRYLAFVGLVVVAASLISYGMFDFVIDRIFPDLYFISYYNPWELMLIVLLYVGFSTVVYLVRQYTIMMISNREKAQNELSALKAQINPHFLFNNLNTIYAMANRGDNRTKDVILQLSDFLRYVLYDTGSEFISLEKETAIIRTYVGLQEERTNTEITPVRLTLPEECGNQKIAPLLLLPLVENCFKHGTGHLPGTIDIKASLEGNRLHFYTSNPVSPREQEPENGGGIGIRNVAMRLNLIYPGKHRLHSEERDGLFQLEMEIDL